MKLIFSPWWKTLDDLLASANSRLRIMAPYFGEATIQRILENTKGVQKQFILALSDAGVGAGAQSVGAIRLIHADAMSSWRCISNLHAKVLIADGTRAIVTSGNLTTSALDTNVEVGVYVDNAALVAQLKKHFDDLWAKADHVDIKALNDLEHLEREVNDKPPGKIYGSKIKFPGHSKMPALKQKALPKFIVGKNYTRTQIHKKVGGNMQTYLPLVGRKSDKHVVCACLTPDLNSK